MLLVALLLQEAGAGEQDGLAVALSAEAAEATDDAPPPPAAEAALLSGLAAHSQWVAFLYELWAAVGEGPGGARPALEQVSERARWKLPRRKVPEAHHAAPNCLLLAKSAS